MVTVVLLKVALMWATPIVMLRRTLRFLAFDTANYLKFQADFLWSWFGRC
jgi:hypothetical protein